MPINKGLFTSNRGDWGTPIEVFEDLDEEFYFLVDVCASEEYSKCPTYFDEDSLFRDWVVPSRGGSCWMNPPYGRRIGLWIEKAFNEWKKGCTVVCLLPSRTDTTWWHDYCMEATEIRFIRGRLRFGKSTNPAPFPSAVVIFNGKKIK